ncbi:MAG: hypothetical protein SGPRY_000675 [Prymnesium sp.]
MLSLAISQLGFSPAGRVGLPAAVSPVAIRASEEGSLPFEDWSYARGILAPKLFVTDTDSLRGVLAVEKISAGEEICVVPRPCCLDLASAEGAGSPIPELVPTPLWSELRWFERLSLWLIAEKRRGSGSVVSGYIGYLPGPEEFADAPLAWTDADLAELRYPPLAVAIREQASELAQLHARLAQSAKVSLEELTWAQQLVLSRAFSSRIASPSEVAPPPPTEEKMGPAKAWLSTLPVVGEMVKGQAPPPAPSALDSLEMAMMPMLDALNHKSTATVTCAFDAERNAFVLTAGASVRKGDQVFLSYGDKSNDELLQLFGFVEENNPHETFLAIGLDEHIRAQCASLFASQAEMERRFGLVSQLGLQSSIAAPELKVKGAPPDAMHALRLLLGSAEEVDGDLMKLSSPASLETEERVWGVIKSYCKVARSVMGGSRKADLKEAQSNAPRRALALQLRVRATFEWHLGSQPSSCLIRF